MHPEHRLRSASVVDGSNLVHDAARQAEVMHPAIATRSKGERFTARALRLRWRKAIERSAGNSAGAGCGLLCCRPFLPRRSTASMSTPTERRSAMNSRRRTPRQRLGNER